jgi:choline dehydrogenase-like flavoprotein
MNLSGMRMFDDADEVDVVVVGSGAGGAPLTASLASAGLRVVVLEAGPNVEPADHTPDETEAVDIIWMGERLSGGGTPTAFGLNNSGRGVGGSTLHWGAFTPRPDARDMSFLSETGQGADWPIRHSELMPYVTRVEQYLGVSGPSAYPWDPDRRYALPPVARNASSDMMIRGCEALGIQATDAPAAVVSRDWQQEGFGLRQACVNCGACHQGCRNGAKVSMDTSYLPAAVSRGAEIRAGSTVHTIETDESGAVAAVIYRRDGVDHRQRCAALVLSAGGIETPRLLLHNSLANSSGQVGRNFMAHGGVQVWGRFDQPMRSYRGYPSSIISEDMVRPPDAGFVGGYLMQSLGVMPLTFATTLIRGTSLWGPELVEALERYPHMAGVGINGECLPSESNLLTLSDEVDELGVPKAHVTFTAGENEGAIEAHAVTTMTDIVSAAGGRDILVLPRSAHTLGTCRMGETADGGVVDADGRSFDIPNLWICDNSVFPSSLTANPGLTTMALSLRTADAILSAAR